MTKMKVIAVKITDDLPSFKVAYQKGDDRFFVRSGGDNFSVGTRVHSGIEGLWKWGYRKVENPPEFLDSEDILNNYTKFELNSKGSVDYQG